MKRQQEDYWLIKEWAQEFRNGLEYFLDITADQFNGKKYFKKYGTIEECILVERNSGFYEVFEKIMNSFVILELIQDLICMN